MPYPCLVDVFLVLHAGDEVLMVGRAEDGDPPVSWRLPGGPLESGEDALAAVVRAAGYQTGLRLDRGELMLCGTVHQRYPQAQGRIGLFFAAPADPVRQGQPHNAEPERAAEIGWFPVRRLPGELDAYCAAGLDLYRCGEAYGSLGWEMP